MISLEQGLEAAASDRCAVRLAFAPHGPAVRQAADRRLSRAAFGRRRVQADNRLQSEGGRLAICRTPLDDTAKAQWRATFAELDTLLTSCAKANLRVVLVVVPDGFQVNRVLCDTLRRRAGYEPKSSTWPCRSGDLPATPKSAGCRWWICCPICSPAAIRSTSR